MTIETICVVGSGRVGTAVSARLQERGLGVHTTGRELETGDAELVLLCVPDTSIAEASRRIPAGPWLAHTSGGTGLSALDPHERRFSLHPLQTFTGRRGAEQLDGAHAAVSAEDGAALQLGFELAATLGLRPFELADVERPLYHAGAVFASNYLVTLHRAAADLFTGAGAPPEALEPLMRRTIENDFELTGPISRGDWETVERHMRVLKERRPQLEPVYRALAEATVALEAAR